MPALIGYLKPSKNLDQPVDPILCLIWRSAKTSCAARHFSKLYRLQNLFMSPSLTFPTFRYVESNLNIRCSREARNYS